MIFVDRKRTLRAPGSMRATPTSLALHILPFWCGLLWMTGFFTLAGAAGFLALTLVIFLPAFLRWPYGRCSMEGDRIRLSPLRFFGLPLTAETLVNPADPEIGWTIIKRRVNIAPRQGAPYVLVMNRPGRWPLWLACSVSDAYLERELRSLTGRDA